MKKNEVTTLTSLVNEGKKIARLSGNRDLNEKIVKAKMKTLEECGQLIPAIVVDANDVINQGLDVVDFTTGDIIREEEAVDYLVLVEGNHRYEAHLRLMASNEERDEQKRYKREFKLLYALNTELPIAKMLSEINIATNPWKGSDYVKGAKINNQQKKLPLLDAMNNLVNKGYSLTSASKWLTFTSKINKKVMDCAIDGNIADELKNTSGLERGLRLLQAAEGIFKETTIQARTVIDWIISKYEKTSDNLKPKFTDKMERFLKNISKEDADFSGVTEMKVVYANEGSSATLVPDVYENGTKVSLNKNYICEWSNEKDENLGTKLVYDISNVTTTNIYSYQNPVSYYCDVYKVSYDGDGEYRERIGYTRFIIVRGNSQINQPNQPNQSGQPITLPGQNNVTTPTTNNTVGNAAKDTTIKETVKGNVLKAGKESIKISIKKIAKAKGYQVQVSTSKKFKKKVTITKLTKKNSIVIKKLKKKKQYFVRTRSYTIVKKKKKFGKWSKVKAIKTK